MSTMPASTAAKIAATANREGWRDVLGHAVTAADVLDAWDRGTHEFESFASFVLQEAEEHGVAA